MEKRQIANDESFRDPTNLENKLKKHQEFEAEVNANEQRIQNIAQVSCIAKLHKLHQKNCLYILNDYALTICIYNSASGVNSVTHIIVAQLFLICM